jgi:predicted Rossmann-fold nucleotide-binding protein
MVPAICEHMRLTLCVVCVCLMAPGPGHAREAVRPKVIRPHQRARDLLPAGPRILVIGSSSGKTSFGERRAGIRLGRAIAGHGGVVVTGGSAGVPYAVVRGAHRKGGQTVAVAPWASMRKLRESGDPVRGFSHIWLTRVPADLGRLGIAERKFNHWSHRQTHDVAVADGVVVTPGHGGTIGELGNALVFRRPVAVLELPGEANAKFVRAMRALSDFYSVDKQGKPPIRFFKSPDRAAQWLLEQTRPQAR